MNKKTPIVILAFNRPDMLKRLLQRVRAWDPDSLWFVVDGPRNENEAFLVDQVKACIDAVDWCSDIHKNYAGENMGCRSRVSTGLNWFFAENEQGIILEDDCLPLKTLFPYFEELLERYRGDERITAIQGSHRLPFDPAINDSYYFSSYFTPDGWATWSRAWSNYSDDVSDAGIVLKKKGLHFRARWYWKRMFRLVDSGKRDSWGYRWMLSNWRTDSLSVFPKISLIENIGYGKDSTHTKGASYRLMPPKNMEFPLRHPREVLARVPLDVRLEDCCYSRSFSQRLLWMLRRYVGLNV